MKRRNKKAEHPSRPFFLRLSCVMLVVVGGAFGTLARYGLSVVLPTPGGWPLPTLAVNLAGALALGMLLESLERARVAGGVNTTVRLVAGTGFLGAFTTYSALALDVTALLGSGWFEAAGVYVGLSLAGGLTAAWAGIHVAVLWRESPSGNAAEHESGAE